MALKNVRREKTREKGYMSMLLIAPDGERIKVFDEFCRHIADNADATRVRYSIVVSRFIDYLYEVGVLGGAPVSRSVINDSIDFYLQLLRHGENISLGITNCNGETEYRDGDEAREAALRKVAKQLGIKPIEPNSWSNTIAPLNRFLRICAMLENEAREIALLRGGIERTLVEASTMDYTPLLEAVTGCTRLSSIEVQFIKQSSMLGGVIRFRGEELTRPRGLSSKRNSRKQQDVEKLDFPMEYFPDLLDAATSYRNKTLWTLLAASGIRRSEALNLEWHHIDFELERVYVLDPEYTRFGRNLSEQEKTQRFKGRTVSWTYLRLPYRTWFFEMLQKYRQKEYVLPADGNDFVFQYLIAPHKGKPLWQAKDSTLNDAFKSAVKRAKIPGPPMLPSHVWTGHSLRHAYGVYMLNDFEVPGQAQPGLTEAELQLLMGHQHISSTRNYARRTEKRILEKLARHELRLLPTPETLSELSPPTTARLEMIPSQTEGSN